MIWEFVAIGILIIGCSLHLNKVNKKLEKATELLSDIKDNMIELRREIWEWKHDV